MSLDKSLKTKAHLVRQRNVLKRAERIARLKADELWQEGDSPLALPKVKVQKVIVRRGRPAKAAAEQKEQKEEGGGK
jgi:small basic protein (TIGR04137 family)